MQKKPKQTLVKSGGSLFFMFHLMFAKCKAFTLKTLRSTALLNGRNCSFFCQPCLSTGF